MPVHNSEIADIFEKLANLLEIEGANPFRVRAYRNAARTIRSHKRSMTTLLDKGADLSLLPDIGDDLAEKIKTIVQTGQLPLLSEVEARTPAALGELLQIPGLGPKRVKALYEHLHIRSAEDVKRAARCGKIRQLPGFGEKTEQRIKERLEQFTGAEQRLKLITAEDFAESLLRYLKNVDGVRDAVVAGSFRRRKETVGDLDILVTATKGSPVMARFVDYDEVVEIVSQGKTRSTVRLRSGLSVDLRVVAQASYGAALVYLTGSKPHNIALRKLAIKRGYKLNEYGVFKGEERIGGKTEKSVYAAVGLPLIPPELRENRGELAAARKRRLPELIVIDDIRGDLHCHTSASDGRHSLRQMADAAIARGYAYMSVNDHSRHVTVANGLDARRLLRQIRSIDKLNDRLQGFRVLKSIEVDILDDGRLDLPDTVLKELDLTVGAIHYGFNLTARRQTDRILRAMDNPYFNILAHPTGRLINERAPYAIDLERIMDAAKDRGCVLELNAHPDRLDLGSEACQLASEKGVRIAISTDAHNASDLDYMRFGIDQGRRGWLEREDVVNTLPLAKLLKALRRK